MNLSATKATPSEKRAPTASLIGDTLIVRDGNSYIIYSPFKGMVARTLYFPEKTSEIRRALTERGFFGNVPETTKRDAVDAWIGFHSLTLLLTRRCNLSCSYCYASAEPVGASMPTELATASLEWFVRQFEGSTIRVSFHGGGEPTLEEETIRATVAKGKELQGRRTVRFHVVTNGTASTKFMDWMMSEQFGISISMDGPPDIQDRNRPLVGGSGSSSIVEANVCRLVERNYPFTVRLTFSPADDIGKIVNYFGKLGVRSLHLEPLFPHGREYGATVFGKHKRQHDVYAPEGGELLVSFLKAVDMARQHGIRITNSHLRHFVRGIGYFCGAASGRSMMVTHDGFLSSCLEVVDANDKDFDSFYLGKYLPKERRFEVDKTKLAVMQSRHADALPECKTCYARYTCSGGCAVKAVRATGNFFERDLPYCRFTRALVPILAKRIAAASKI